METVKAEPGSIQYLELLLDHIESLIACPSIFISEYFNDLRNKIDLHAERLLAEFDSEIHVLVIKEINSRRSDMIIELAKKEDYLQNELLSGNYSDEAPASLELCADFKSRIEELARKLLISSSDELKDDYDGLYWHMSLEAKRLESAIMSNQTIMFKQDFRPLTNSDFKRGLLIHIEGYYLRNKALFENSQYAPYFLYVSSKQEMSMLKVF